MKITEELAKIENIIDVLPHQINPCKICEHAKNWLEILPILIWNFVLLVAGIMTVILK